VGPVNRFDIGVLFLTAGLKSTVPGHAAGGEHAVRSPGEADQCLGHRYFGIGKDCTVPPVKPDTEIAFGAGRRSQPWVEAAGPILRRFNSKPPPARSYRLRPLERVADSGDQIAPLIPLHNDNGRRKRPRLPAGRRIKQDRLSNLMKRNERIARAMT